MRLILYWAFLLAFGLGLVSGFIIIFFSRFSFKFFFFYKNQKRDWLLFFGQTEIRPMVESVTS